MKKNEYGFEVNTGHALTVLAIINSIALVIAFFEKAYTAAGLMFTSMMILIFVDWRK